MCLTYRTGKRGSEGKAAQPIQQAKGSINMRLNG